MRLIKPVGGAIIGVTIPIGIEYAAKGQRISGFKWSGLIGTGAGLAELLIAWAGHSKRIGWPREDEDVALMGAMGGAKLATGASILVLDELRKRAAYTFKKERGENLRITRGEGEEGLERIEYPVEKLVEEI